jgi:ATP-binding cassette, subfamily F, member 3
MIQVHDLSLSLGTQTIFDTISFVIGVRQRIGVLGRNGAGKSTLLKMLAGLIAPDNGEITLEKGKKIAYMPQEVTLLSEKMVYDEAFEVFSHFVALEQRKKELEALLDSGISSLQAIEEYLGVQQELEMFDFSAARARTERILKGLGFTDAMFVQPVATLSVGWKMRLILAKLLLQEADFYLFDEPTNHLDLVTKGWFFDFLKNGRFGFLLVTHDRYYLDHACDTLLALDRGKAAFFNGTFTEYVQYKEKEREMQEAAAERQRKEIARKQETIDRFRASASKAKMAQSMIKQLEKIEIIEIESLLPTIKLSFPPVTRAGTTVVGMRNLQQSFEDRVIFESISAEVQRGEKVALVAPNGTGKTTLFNLITGKYSLQKGAVTFGHNVSYAIFEQDQMRALNPKSTVFQEVLAACPDITEATVRSFLGSFLFSGDTIHKKIEVLSGGERNRVAMVKVLLQKANLLLLDEPTNHLDLYAKEVLLQALQKYEGTMLLVSHDHDFLNKLATRILELTPTGLYSYPGNYDAYLEQKRASTVMNHNGTSGFNGSLKKELQSTVSSGKELFALRKEIASLEDKIGRMEREIESINKLFLTYVYGTSEYKDTFNKLDSAQKSLKECMHKWELLVQKLEDAQ